MLVISAKSSKSGSIMANTIGGVEGAISEDVRLKSRSIGVGSVMAKITGGVEEVILEEVGGTILGVVDGLGSLRSPVS
jgi:hypothetical protein